MTRRLLNEEKRRKLLSQPESDSALLAKTRKRQRPVEEVTCFECKKKGHYRNECPELKTKEEKADVATEFAF